MHMKDAEEAIAFVGCQGAESAQSWKLVRNRSPNAHHGDSMGWDAFDKFRPEGCTRKMTPLERETSRRGCEHEGIESMGIQGRSRLRIPVDDARSRPEFPLHFNPALLRHGVDRAFTAKTVQLFIKRSGAAS